MRAWIDSKPMNLNSIQRIHPFRHFILPKRMIPGACRQYFDSMTPQGQLLGKTFR
jgi:hypothetical protein